MGAESGWGRGAGRWVAVGFIRPISNVVVGEHANNAMTAGNISLAKLPWHIGPWDAGNPNIWALPAQQPPPGSNGRPCLEGGSVDQAATGPSFGLEGERKDVGQAGGFQPIGALVLDAATDYLVGEHKPGLAFSNGLAALLAVERGNDLHGLAGSWSPDQHKDTTDPKSQNTRPKKVDNALRARTRETWDIRWGRHGLIVDGSM